MAIFAQIKTVRLEIHDPIGFIDIQQVATALSLPSSPASQTVYNVLDTGKYMAYESSAWVEKSLKIADSLLSTYIDLYGVKGAAVKAVQNIIVVLGQELFIQRSGNGTETVEFQSLSAMHSFYKDIIATLKDDDAKEAGLSTGIMFNVYPREIGGVREW